MIKECCICLEYLNTDIHVLKCCLNDIHTKCIYEMFVFVEDDSIFTCPLCRTCDKFNDILTLKDTLLKNTLINTKKMLK